MQHFDQKFSGGATPKPPWHHLSRTVVHTAPCFLTANMFDASPPLTGDRSDAQEAAAAAAEHDAVY